MVMSKKHLGLLLVPFSDIFVKLFLFFSRFDGTSTLTGEKFDFWLGLRYELKPLVYRRLELVRKCTKMYKLFYDNRTNIRIVRVRLFKKRASLTQKPFVLILCFFSNLWLEWAFLRWISAAHMLLQSTTDQPALTEEKEMVWAGNVKVCHRK